MGHPSASRAIQTGMPSLNALPQKFKQQCACWSPETHPPAIVPQAESGKLVPASRFHQRGKGEPDSPIVALRLGSGMALAIERNSPAPVFTPSACPPRDGTQTSPNIITSRTGLIK